MGAASCRVGRAGLGFAGAVVLVGGASALAQTAAQPSASYDGNAVVVREARGAGTVDEAIAPDSRWQLRVEPAAWYAGLGGKFAMPTSAATGTNQKTRFIDLAADNPIFTPFGEAKLRWNEWLFGVSGFAFSRKATSIGFGGQVGDLAFATTDTTTLRYEMTSIDLTAGYRVVKHRGMPQGKGEPSLRVDVDIVGGARLLDAKAEFSVPTLVVPAVLPPPPTSASASELFIQPMVGARLEFEMYEQAGFDVQITGGYFPGGHESTTFDIIAGFWWEPIDHVMVQVGYRSLFFDYKAGDAPNDFSANASLQGLYFGAVVRF